MTTVLLAAALTLAGCGSTGTGSTDDELGGPDTGVVSGGEEPGPVGEPDVAEDVMSDRDVIVTGSATITADDPIAAAQQAASIVAAAGGRVDARSEWGPTDYGPGSARLELRIPADQLDAVIEKFRDIGRVDSVSTDAMDVTVQTRDLDARISALESSVARIQALMADAKDIGDLILIESELSSRQAELEGLRAQQRALADQVAMSTIWVEFRAPQDAESPFPDTFPEGLAAGWAAFVAFWAGVLVVLGFAAPWLIFFAVVAAAIVWIVRRRRRRPAAAPAAEPVPGPTAAGTDTKAG